MKEATRDATKKPMMNFGNLCQISPAPTFSPFFLSTTVAKKRATKNAMKPMRMFWIILMSTAAFSASPPSAEPATATAPVLSTVPPMREPPMIGLIPVALMRTGSRTIISTVKMMEMEMVIVRSSFLHLLAAPVAMAAEVPQTLVAEAIVITSGLLSILRTLVPNHHMNMMTIGVTTHAIPRP